MRSKLTSLLTAEWGAVLLLFILCPLLYFFLPESLLAFRRPMIADGQWYRLLTGNLLHTNHWHLLMNLAGLAVIVSLFRWPFGLVGMLALLLFLCIAEGLGLYWFFPGLVGYVGLSGVLHGLFAFGATNEVLTGIRFGWILLAGIIAKVSYEMYTGGSAELASLISARVAVESHLVGMLAGIVAALAWHFLSKANRLSHSPIN